MAEATKKHNKIVASIIGALSQHLKEKSMCLFPQ
jgi:hypothetical protein